MIRRVAGGLAALGALAPSSCGVPPAARPSPRPGDRVVTLRLHDDVGDEQLLACSLVHHYGVFRDRHPIPFDGTVGPPPRRFKVTVKIKRCVDGRFQDSGASDIRGLAGRYSSTLQPPGKGVYFARTRLRTAGGDVLSRKTYFEVK